MDRFRLKNIIILILLLLNGFLLFSLAQRRTAERDAFRRTAEQLVALFQGDGMELDSGAISRDSPPAAVTLTRDTALEERAAAFQEQCGQAFGGGVLNPENLIDAKRFDVKTEQATISIDPAYSYLVETRIIGGRKYLLIPAGEGVEVNGLSVELEAGKTEE